MEENKGKKVVLRKVHLQSFIDVLTELFESGVDFVDIHGTDGEEQDIIELFFDKDYTIFNDSKEDDAETVKKDIELSDDNLNEIV